MMEKTDLLNKIINEPKKLSDSQRDAFLSEKGHIRIIAGAGAEKTETLTRKPYRMEAKPNQIFFFIFIGERSDIQYIKTNIELNSVKFPLELMGMEWDIT